MDQKKIDFRPGVVKDDTPLASEGAYSDSNWIRWRRGRPENVKGYGKLVATQYTGKARGSKAWSSLAGVAWFAFGTSSKLYAVRGTTLLDVTPNGAEGALDNPFKTKSGSPIVRVRHAGHGLVAGDSITFSNAMPSGGITINGTYTVTTVLDSNNYTITHGSNASSTNSYPDDGGVWPDDATSQAGGRADFIVPLAAGVDDGTSSVLPRTWDLDNIGEVLFANPSGGRIYMFQPADSYPELLINTTFTSIGTAGTTDWAAGSSLWSSQSGGVARFFNNAGFATSNLSQNIQGKAKPGYVYEASIEVSTFTQIDPDSDTPNTLKFYINAGDPTPSLIDVGMASIPIWKAGTYKLIFVCPDNPVDIVFSAHYHTGSLTIDLKNPSLKLLGRATYISQAPSRVDHIFATPQGCLVAMGCTQLDGEYNPLVVRNSGRLSPRVWVPDTDNLAGEVPIAGGSKIIGGLATRGQNLIWTDSSVFSQVFKGAAGDAYACNLVASGGGLLGPLAKTEQNGIVFWWSNNGNLMVFRGGEPSPVDCPVRGDYFENVAQYQEYKVVLGINPSYNELWWFYPDARDSAGANKENSRAYAYNWAENHFAPHLIGRTSWLPDGIFKNPIGFGSDNYVYRHEYGGTFDGSAMTAFLETSYFDIEDGANLMRFDRYVADFSTRRGSAPFVGTVTLKGKRKMRPHDTETTDTLGSITSSTLKNDFIFKECRQMKIRWEITGTGSNCDIRWGVMSVSIKKSGSQR